MPAERKFGMDHPHYEWSPLSTRGILRWPQDSRVALCVIIALEHMEWEAPPDSYQVTNLAGGSAPRAFPDYARLSHREYGHRVGIFRVLDVLDKYNIKATVAMDALTAENYPYLVRHCLDRGCEVIGHGISVSRTITSNMSLEEENEYIRASIESLIRATGSAPQGWLGPEYGESTRTPQLLARAGLRYVCDWANDEQPYPMKTDQGQLFALPIMLELDDIIALAHRRVTVDSYGAMLKQSFDTMYQDGSSNGRLIVLNLHPWLIGQPFRIGVLDDALGYIMRRQGVWATTGSEIIEWYRSHPRQITSSDC
jgi:allantoinase